MSQRVECPDPVSPDEPEHHQPADGSSAGVPLPLKPGRPKVATGARQQLITAARDLFASQGYQQVSTRQLAARAGVNAGLIRYYFVDKAGLFEAMLRETLQPLQQLLQAQLQDKAALDPADLIALYYQVMGQQPLLPKLIFSSLHQPARAEHQIVVRVFASFLQQMLQNFHKVLQSQQVLQPGVNPLFSQLSCLSLAVFPFLLPPMVAQAIGFIAEPATLTALAAHQRQLLTQGVLQALPADASAHSNTQHHFAGASDE